MKNIKIGRDSDNQITLPPDERLSRYHATLEINKDGSMVLRDHSANGTMINGTKIHNSSLPVQHGATVLFAGFARLNWSEVSDPKSATTFKWWYVALPLLTMIIGLGVYFYPSENRIVILPPTPEQIDLKFSKSVGLIVHAYYLKKEINGLKKPLFIGYSKAVFKHFDKYYLAADEDRQNLMPFIEMGTGFLLSSKDGNIVTNRHVANPSWLVNRDRDQLDDERKEFIDTIDNRIFRYLNGKSTIDKATYIVHTLKMKFLPSGSNVNIQNNITDEEFLASIQNVGYDISRVREHREPEIDLALLRSLSPIDTSRYHLINYNTEVEFESDSTKVANPVYLIGFSGGLVNSYAKYRDEINRIFQPGHVSSEPNNYYIEYGMNGVNRGSSGSPVFNSKGRLVAINSRGVSNVTGQGVHARYLHKLVTGQNTDPDAN